MDNNNLIAAVILSVIILVGFQYLYVKPQQEAYRQQVLTEKLAQTDVKPNALNDQTAPKSSRAEIINQGERVKIITPELHGSINLKGARIDDLTLAQYHETTDPSSAEIVLLSPAGSAPPQQAYYAEFGWLGDKNMAVPTSDTVWKAEGKELTPEHPLKLVWDNKQGLTFERTFAIDDHFMFTVTDHVQNHSASPALLYPYGLVTRQGKPPTRDIYILHEGPLGVLDGTLKDPKYKDLMTDTKITTPSTGGWLGITDKYWLVAVIPPQDEKVSAEFVYDRGSDPDPLQGQFQSDFRSTAFTIAPEATAEHVAHLFAGAKLVRILDRYQTQFGIPLFDHAIDFGWFYFLTKPFLYLLDFLSHLFGSFGLAILAFTVLLKVITLPLSLKSYRSMAKMKALQPEMQRLQERFKDDKLRQSAEVMDLYKREKVSPLSGCLPNLIQIPIFFALYKVLYVGIEMRQTPFYGWIKDLSAPDPTSVFTLCGLIHWMPPNFLQIGIWPLMMGLSMFMQQRLSPQPPDKTQARMFMFLPIIFTYMLRAMPSGLVIYWTWSNLLSIAQQWFIMWHAPKKTP